MNDVLCISTTDWDEIWGSRQQIMSRLLDRDCRILFVERQITLEHIIRNPKIIKKRFLSNKPPLREVGENLWIYQPPLLAPGRYYSKTINKFSQRFLAKKIKIQLNLLSFQKPILWIYPPQSSPLIDYLPQKLVIYHCIDRFSAGQKGIKKLIIESQELDLIQKSDLIFVNGNQLMALFEKYTSTPIIFISSAADIKLFQSTSEIHPQITQFPSPRLGIIGTFDARLDTQLLIHIAQSHPNWHLVLIGHTRPGLKHFDELLGISNVHWLGSQPFLSLVNWMNGMDVLLIPYIVNQLTQYINPLKVYEYLAVGKPIVSTDLPEIRSLAHLVDITQSNNMFIEAINKALIEDSTSKVNERRRVAFKHDWDDRVNTMWELIQDAIQENATD